VNRYLLSRSQHHEWIIPKWFRDAVHYIESGEHREAYIQNTYSAGSCKSMEYEFEANYTGLLSVTKPNKYRNVNYDYTGTQTYCNYAVATVCAFFGREDIGWRFKHPVNDAIKLMLAQSEPQLKNGITLLENQPDYTEWNKSLVEPDKFYIAMQENKSGHGHTAPLVGYDNDGILHVFNTGAFFRHGVVPIEGKNDKSAFYSDGKDLLYFEVKRV